MHHEGQRDLCSRQVTGHTETQQEPMAQMGHPRPPSAQTVRAQKPRDSFAQGPSSEAPAAAVLLQ